MVCVVWGILSSAIERPGVSGASTRSKLGPNSASRKASSSPTSENNNTLANNWGQHGRTYQTRRISRRETYSLDDGPTGMEFLVSILDSTLPGPVPPPAASTLYLGLSRCSAF